MDIKEIWATPRGGVPPDVTGLARAPDMEALGEATMPFWEAQASDLENDLEDGLGAGQDDFPPARVGFWDRVLDIWDGILDLFTVLRHRKALESEARAFAVQLPMGMTRPTWDLEFGYEELFAETAAFRDAIAAQITAVRGPEFRIVTSPDKIDDAIEDDVDMTGFAHTLAGLTQYWPPKGEMPALALYEMQDDGGLPVEVALIAHGAVAHDAMIARLDREFDGRLEQIAP